MSRPSDDPSKLLLQIDAAFSDVPHPGDDHIVESMIHDPEREKIKKVLQRQHWRDIPFETLESLRSALPFLTPEAYRFYLPAFMFFAVSDFARADTIPDEVIQSLTLPHEVDLDRMRTFMADRLDELGLDRDEWEQFFASRTEHYASGAARHGFLDRVSGFNPKQRKAIRAFLEYMRDTYGEDFPNREPEVALERYWSST